MRRRYQGEGRPHVGLRRLRQEAAEELSPGRARQGGDDPDASEGSGGGGTAVVPGGVAGIPGGGGDSTLEQGLASDLEPEELDDKDLYAGMVRRLIRRARQGPRGGGESGR